MNFEIDYCFQHVSKVVAFGLNTLSSQTFGQSLMYGLKSNFCDSFFHEQLFWWPLTYFSVELKKAFAEIQYPFLSIEEVH